MSKTSIQTARGPAAPPTGVTTATKNVPTPATQPRPVGLPWKILTVVASLRITVVLFVLSLLLVFFGTMAQMDEGINAVLHNIFRCWVAWIPTRTLVRFGQVFFGVDRHIIPSARVFPFPGGYILGGVMLINVIAAHIVRFRYSWRRSGILLIHVGIALLLIGELVTSLFAIEGRMILKNHGTSNYTEDYQKCELAFVDPSDPRTDSVVVIPGSILQKGGLIQDSRLPVDVQVVQYMANSKLEDNPSGEDRGPMIEGEGRVKTAVEVPPISGTQNDEMDYPSVYVAFRQKDSEKVLGTYLMSTSLSADGLVPLEQPVKVGDRTYGVALRFARTYRPFTFQLLKFHHDLYPGTSIPSNYSSKIRILDPETKENREVEIWMNNPLRLQGETFYQAGFLPGDRGTILQVVYNPGAWMPYFSCTLVAVGLVVHFLLHLIGFAKRRVAS